jgi:hypothetical protein
VCVGGPKGGFGRRVSTELLLFILSVAESVAVALLRGALSGLLASMGRALGKNGVAFLRSRRKPAPSPGPKSCERSYC